MSVNPNDTTKMLALLNQQQPKTGRVIREDGSVVNEADVMRGLGLQTPMVLQRFDEVDGWEPIPGFGDTDDTIEVVQGIVGNALQFNKVHTDSDRSAFKFVLPSTLDLSDYIGGKLNIWVALGDGGSNVASIGVYLATSLDPENFQGVSINSVYGELLENGDLLQCLTLDIPTLFSQNDGPNLEEIAAVGVSFQTNNDNDTASVIFDHLTISRPAEIFNENDLTKGGIAAFDVATGATANAIDEGSDSPMTLKSVRINNNAAAVSYLQIFKTGRNDEVTLGTTVPDYVIPVPANGNVYERFPDWFSPDGFCYAVTTTKKGSTAPASAPDVFFLYNVE